MMGFRDLSIEHLNLAKTDMTAHNIYIACSLPNIRLLKSLDTQRLGGGGGALELGGRKNSPPRLNFPVKSGKLERKMGN